MKNIFLTALICFLSYFGFSQADCDTYFPYEVDEEIVRVSYDKKEKITGYTVMTVKEKSSSHAEVEIQAYDKKNKETTTLSYEIDCEGNTFSIDMEAYLPQDQMAAVENMEIEVTGDPLELPNQLIVGEDLKDGEITMKIEMNDVPFMTMKVEIYDRKVDRVETLKTSVGDFECFVIKQKIKTKAGIIKAQVSSEEFWCQGEGLIKTVTYNKNDKLIGYEVIGLKSDVE